MTRCANGSRRSVPSLEDSRASTPARDPDSPVDGPVEALWESAVLSTLLPELWVVWKVAIGYPRRFHTMAGVDKPLAYNKLRG